MAAPKAASSSVEALEENHVKSVHDAVKFCLKHTTDPDAHLLFAAAARAAHKAGFLSDIMLVGAPPLLATVIARRCTSVFADAAELIAPDLLRRWLKEQPERQLLLASFVRSLLNDAAHADEARLQQRLDIVALLEEHDPEAANLFKSRVTAMLQSTDKEEKSEKDIEAKKSSSTNKRKHSEEESEDDDGAGTDEAGAGAGAGADPQGDSVNLDENQDAVSANLKRKRKDKKKKDKKKKDKKKDKKRKKTAEVTSNDEAGTGDEEKAENRKKLRQAQHQRKKKMRTASGATTRVTRARAGMGAGAPSRISSDAVIISISSSDESDAVVCVSGPRGRGQGAASRGSKCPAAGSEVTPAPRTRQNPPRLAKSRSHAPSRKNNSASKRRGGSSRSKKKEKEEESEEEESEEEQDEEDYTFYGNPYLTPIESSGGSQDSSQPVDWSEMAARVGGDVPPEQKTAFKRWIEFLTLSVLDPGFRPFQSCGLSFSALTSLTKPRHVKARAALLARLTKQPAEAPTVEASAPSASEPPPAAPQTARRVSRRIIDSDDEASAPPPPSVLSPTPAPSASNEPSPPASLSQRRLRFRLDSDENPHASILSPEPATADLLASRHEDRVSAIRYLYGSIRSIEEGFTMRRESWVRSASWSQHSVSVQMMRAVQSRIHSLSIPLQPSEEHDGSDHTKCNACLRNDSKEMLVLFGRLPSESSASNAQDNDDEKEEEEDRDEEEEAEEEDEQPEEDEEQEEEEEKKREDSGLVDPFEFDVSNESKEDGHPSEDESAIALDRELMQVRFHKNRFPSFAIGEWCAARVRLYQVMFHFTSHLVLKIQKLLLGWFGELQVSLGRLPNPLVLSAKQLDECLRSITDESDNWMDRAFDEYCKLNDAAEKFREPGWKQKEYIFSEFDGSSARHPIPVDLNGPLHMPHHPACLRSFFFTHVIRFDFAALLRLRADREEEEDKQNEEDPNEEEQYEEEEEQYEEEEEPEEEEEQYEEEPEEEQ